MKKPCIYGVSEDFPVNTRLLGIMQKKGVEPFEPVVAMRYIGCRVTYRVIQLNLMKEDSNDGRNKKPHNG